MNPKCLIIILAIMLLGINESVFIKYLFNDPDLEAEEIPEKWRQLCGFRYLPYERHINYRSKCFATDLVRNFSESYRHKRRLSRFLWFPIPKVQHGVNAKDHESPWIVQIALKKYKYFGLSYDYHHRCTGVLITMKHILTAAHCKK